MAIIGGSYFSSRTARRSCSQNFSERKETYALHNMHNMQCPFLTNRLRPRWSKGFPRNVGSMAEEVAPGPGGHFSSGIKDINKFISTGRNKFIFTTLRLLNGLIQPVEINLFLPM